VTSTSAREAHSSGALFIAIVALLSAAAWIAASALPPLARIWTTILLVPLPALMIVQARQIQTLEHLPRIASYISSIVSLCILVLITMLIARYSGFTRNDIGLVDTLAPGQHAAAALALVLIAVALLFAFRFAGFREVPVLRQLIPVTARDRAIFVLLSLSAGVGEEIMYRGFMQHTLVIVTGSPAVAVVLSSISFGALHAYQGRVGAARAALLGALLAVPVLLNATLYPSMIAHTTIDVVSGIWLAKYLLR